MPPPPSTYQYLGLTEPDSIRILLLFPSSHPTSEVKCDLIHARLSENIEGKNSYTTLSYVWGNERDSHSVRVRDKRLTVGRNVDSALRHLRRRDLPIRLWVDAICINQLDLTERNHQVHQMRAIYSASQETIIYLGDEDGGNTCNSAWNFLERHCHWAMNKNHDIDYTLPTARENILEFRGDLEDVGSDVLKRAWFRRVWVFQEVVVSQKLSIQCGNRRIPWDDFCKILLLSPRHHDQYGLSMSRSEEIDAVRDMFQARCSYQKTHGLEHLRPSWHADVEDYKGQSSDVLNVLARSRRLESSDPRDKIFALLGISTGIDLDDEKVAINYRKPCVLVYRDFAKYIMETTNSYDLLSYLDKNLVGAEEDPTGDYDRMYVDPPFYSFYYQFRHHGAQDIVLARNTFGSSRPEYDLLPTWVPNWDRSSWKTQYINRTILSTLGPELATQREQRESLTKKSRLWINWGNTLVALGAIIGEVDQIGPTIALQGREELAFQDKRDQHSDDQHMLYREIMALWGKIFTKTNVYQDGIHDQDRLSSPKGSEKTEPYLPLPWSIRYRKFLEFKRLVCTSPNPPQHSVEHHLFNRAQKTATWTDNNNKGDAIIIDKSSFVDRKRLAVYKSLPTTQSDRPEGLAMLPARARLGDLLVYLRGARVPFAVRYIPEAKRSGQSSEVLQWKKISQKLGVNFETEFLACRIVGECLVNGFDEFVQEDNTASNDTEGVASMLPGKKPLVNEMRRIFLIS